MRLNRKFFDRPTIVVAKELLGKYLVRQINGKVTTARITETEAYCGQTDLACHASRGFTERTKIMFGPPGYAYVYLIYGMYHCLNVVTREAGCPEAVLIRGAEIAARDWRLATRKNKKLLMTRNYSLVARVNGPGKLCRALKIDRNLNGINTCNSQELWIEDSALEQSTIRGKLDWSRISSSKIKKGKRIGVDYAGKWKDKLWRFSI